MRRMYGDIRHISILKEEINNNEIDVEDIHHAANRYSRMNSEKKKQLHSHTENGRGKIHDIISEPYFRPTQKTTTPKPSQGHSNLTTASTVPVSEASSTIKSIFFNESIQGMDDLNKSVSQKQPIVEQMLEIDASEIDIKKLSSIANLETNDELHKNESILKNENKTNFTKSDSSGLNQNNNSTFINSNVTSIVKDDNSLNIVNANISSSISSKPMKFIETQKNPEKKKKPAKKPEEQLFQDTAPKEPSVSNLRGINACPVKEEVVAPFWANNTRGEVLALLNLYPFEQYVHWEKCAYEFKQMYCREGCRCEQQYRLHRLLAYDPHNECRGIFSDWFRFPSCCICKCYDIPFDFRITSRSPRKIEESIKVVEDDLQNAIYDHAVNEWYNRNDVE
ncbi:protein spaetzle 4 isoform X2 [Uranotaenia lowii]|nr:protein spaetzle 4 isoform X2 [Uranotaenia lowii]